MRGSWHSTLRCRQIGEATEHCKQLAFSSSLHHTTELKQLIIFALCRIVRRYLAILAQSVTSGVQDISTHGRIGIRFDAKDPERAHTRVYEAATYLVVM